MKKLVTEEQTLMWLQQWKTLCFTSSAFWMLHQEII